MLIDFFLKLKSHKLPVSIKEYLTLLEAMDRKVIGPSVDDFYYLSRATLVKDEANFDKFDRAFAEFWQGVEKVRVQRALGIAEVPEPPIAAEDAEDWV
ncbi:MAG: hypothetical protein HW393_627 [Dehalococcoidia bacterium]|nr:hypothetical protein [Dehalococcoidia bacterium]